jgi:hypothetical protein
MSSADTCLGCAFSQRRFKHSKPRLYCQRFHRTAEIRCIDYRTKRSAIQVALDYLKRSSIK